MRVGPLAVIVLVLAATGCKTDECKLGESPCNGPTTYLECQELSSHTPDFSSSFNRFVEQSCGDLFSRCMPQGDDGHECVLGFEAIACEVLLIDTIQVREVSKVLVGDLSGDGHADLLFVSPAGLSLRRHTPEGNFAPPDALPEQARSLASPSKQRAWLADLDGDRRLDVLREVHGSVGARNFRYRVDVLLARDSGFEARDLGVDLPIRDVGDLDGDGLSEVVAISEGTIIIVRFEDDAFERTSVVVEPVPDGQIQSLVAADVYGTGQALLIAQSRDDTYVLERAGDGYELIDDPRLAPLGPRAVFADFNGDGATDIAEVPRHQVVLRIRLSNRDGTFHDQEVPLPHSPSAFEADVLGDVDGDGAPDLVLYYGDGIVSIVLNDGEGRFLAPRTFELDEQPYALTVAPVDSTNPQADLITLQGDFLGFVPRSCL